MKDLYNHIEFVQAIKPVLVSDNTVPAAAIVDLAGFNSAVIELSVGLKSADAGTITLKAEHSDTSSFANVAAADMQGVTPAEGVIYTIDTDSDDSTSRIVKFGYVGGKRYLKLTIAEGLGANANGVILGVTVVKGHGLDAPAIS
jgi:PHD/YefM family antitoxin component YafN of YafNO toxin-antitoxin module